jgi:hypothetical protein
LELTGALLTEVLKKAEIVYVSSDGSVYDALKEDVDLRPYIENAATELKWRFNV